MYKEDESIILADLCHHCKSKARWLRFREASTPSQPRVLQQDGWIVQGRNSQPWIKEGENAGC